MKVFVAGAGGVIGRRLVPALLAAGHSVDGMTRSAARAGEIEAMGATPVVCDALDAAALAAAVAASAPDAVIHQLTAIPQRIDPRRMQRDFVLNDRLRSEGTRNLVAAAGGRPVIAQSIAFSYAPGPPGTLHDEDDPLLAAGDAPPVYARSAQAVIDLEHSVLGAGGTVLRYGYFYGPGSAWGRDGSGAADVLRRRLPIVGGGAGVWSFVHVDDAASATLCALERGARGVFNVCDDEPACARDWIPAYAAALGAPRPMRVPAWVARPIAGAWGVQAMTRAQGARNARAREQLGWTPRHPSWREGFATAL